MAVLVDTSFLLDFLAEQSDAVATAATIDEPVMLSEVSLYELLAGETNTRRMKRVDALARDFAVVPAGHEVCLLAAGIQTRLFGMGSRIPSFDAIVAATAILAGVTLVAEDEHFLRIPSEFGLSVRRYRVGSAA